VATSIFRLGSVSVLPLLPLEKPSLQKDSPPHFVCSDDPGVRTSSSARLSTTANERLNLGNGKCIDNGSLVDPVEKGKAI
jgi:hypothetical protein